ncbi:MAG: metallophosphoesterase, partial [Devosiaceae bacterium]|nr:metallophosphoesterase [Devosiaceae bacterium MH13]
MRFTLAHLSDCHLGPLPAVTAGQLASKRVLGYLNWQRNRAKRFDPSITERLIDDLKAQAPDHIAVTGDLTNLALPDEFPRAATFLADLGAPEHVTAIPGNHDAYVRDGLERFNAAIAPNLTSDPSAEPATGTPYPIVRRRDGVTLIGVSTAIATGPFMATGAVGARQTEALRVALATAAGSFRIVLIHHPPHEGSTSWHKRLIDAARVRKALADAGAELVLHGHTHLPTVTGVPGPQGAIPVWGVASAAQAPGGHKPAAAYTLFTVETADNGDWQVTAE